MTDTVLNSGGIPGRSVHTNDGARGRLARRYTAERRFKWLGAGAVAVAILLLGVLLSTIVVQAVPAFRANYLLLPVDLSEKNVDSARPENADYDAIVRDGLYRLLPGVTSRSEKRALRGIVSSASGFLLQRDVVAGSTLRGGATTVGIPLDDFADLYMKGLLAEKQTVIELAGAPSIAVDGGMALITNAPQILDAITARGAGRAGDDGGIRLSVKDPSFLVETGRLVLKIKTASAARTDATILHTVPMAGSKATQLRIVETPESQRKISDQEVAWLNDLQNRGAIESRWSELFLFSGASREPEIAGIWGAVVGSLLTLIVTLALAFPVGVGAAVYLEEFAPKNRWTQLIEVNINNLAAVPSIVFGLLGLAVFLNWFNLPRSAPVVGGFVLALMTLPTIIIAARASLRAVPLSVREAALGIGASRAQTVLHHVLPLAMPGIMTGTIIGMAQALGETAPLLMIGMVAFIVDIPGGFTDPATVLPVQIFMWADFPEPAFRHKTAGAILVLLAFLVLMNALAVILRRRFERRW